MVSFTIQMLGLPVPVLGVLIWRRANPILLLQQGLSHETAAQVIAEALAEAERQEGDSGVRQGPAEAG